MSSRITGTAVALLCFLVVSTPAFAQTSNAILGGTVADATGALIPGVTVTATNNQTGVVTTAISTVAGAYQFVSLPPGVYTVRASLPGFEASNNQMELGTSEQRRLNFTLQIAQAPADPLRALVGRLDLEKYKATIKGLTQFGDRRQGTDRNRSAIDWIEAQLKSYGCTNTERLTYQYLLLASPRAPAAGGVGRTRGVRVRTGVNQDPNAQPDLKLRELNTQPTTPGPREEVYCTKIGTTRPDEMYIVGAHMDGHGWGEAANDDGSGTALVMELARVFSSPDVQTDRSIRFILWNNEETGLEGSRAYVAQRQALQGKEDPPDSGLYPEPKWLGMVQHDMMLFDHGMPRADGTVSPEQRPEADVNIEFQVNSKFAVEAQALAWTFQVANERYASDYPAAIGSHMSNTDSGSFQDAVAAISLRENDRGTQIGNGWDPHWHQPTDVFATFTDKDFLLGLNAAQTTLGAIAQLAGATIRK